MAEAEKAIQYCLNTGNDFNFASWSGSQLAQTEERLEQWYKDVVGVLDRIFTTAEMGERFLQNTLDASRSQTSDESKHYLTVRGTFDHRMAWLRRQLETLAVYALPTEEKPDTLSTIQLICSRFHTVARQLRQRHDSRDTLDISDEYDVQDLLHALLRIFFDDIREEEYAPSYAGGASRIDFLLKTEQIVVEVKKTRLTLKAKELGEELIIDIARYQTHQDCKMLYCFVYDPDGYIRNPQGIENDLRREGEPFPVIVFIAPKTH
jgi:hypothetical protein